MPLSCILVLCCSMVRGKQVSLDLRCGKLTRYIFNEKDNYYTYGVGRNGCRW